MENISDFQFPDCERINFCGQLLQPLQETNKPSFHSESSRPRHLHKNSPAPGKLQIGRNRSLLGSPASSTWENRMSKRRAAFHAAATKCMSQDAPEDPVLRCTRNLPANQEVFHLCTFSYPQITNSICAEAVNQVFSINWVSAGRRSNEGRQSCFSPKMFY